MPLLRPLFAYAALTVLALFAASPLSALEVSEVTVDFPLSEVLTIQETEGEVSPEMGRIVGSRARAWRPAWEEDWFAYRQGVLRGNFESAGKNLEKVIEYKEERGIPNLYLPSAALLVEASTARKQGRYGHALKLSSYARELAPDTPAPYFQKARIIWSQNQLRALSALDSLLEGIGVFFKDFRSFFPWGLSLLLWILVALTIASFLAIFLFTLRVAPRIAHDLSHIVKVPQWLWYVAFFILLGAVLVAGLPFTLWTVLIALLMLFHLTGRERVTVGVALVFMASIPLTIHILALGNDYYSGSAPLVIYEAERGGEGSPTLESLHRFRVENPQDSQVLAAMAIVLKRSGSLREAESLLHQALEISPDSPDYINNLGNIFMSTGRIEQAVEHYRQALRYRDDPRLHYNLSQALRENLQLEEGEKEFLMAQDMEPGLASDLLQSQKEGGRRITFDMYGGTRGVFMDALSLTPEGYDLRGRLWAGIVPFIPFSGSWLLFLGASAIIFSGHLAGGKIGVSRRCRRCNHTHCPKCSKSSTDMLCAQCRQIFLVRSGVDPAGRVKKMMQILRFNKKRALVSRVATVLLPGMGHIYLGAGWQALVLITISTLFWTKWIFWYGFFRITTILEIQASLFSRVSFGILLGLFYLYSLKKVGDRLEDV